MLVQVCAASTKGENPLSASSWFNNEVENQLAPHTDKNLVYGDKSYQKLVQYFNSWACKQLGGDDAEQRVGLTEKESQEMACNFIWRRDQAPRPPRACGAPNLPHHDATRSRAAGQSDTSRARASNHTPARPSPHCFPSGVGA